MPARRVKAIGDQRIRLLIAGGWSAEADKEVAAGGFDTLEFHGGDYANFEFLAPHARNVHAIAVLSGSFKSAAGLSALENLKSLSLGVKIKDVDFAALPALESLGFDAWLPAYADSVFACANLRTLRIEGYDREDAAQFGRLPQLKRLTLAKGPLHSLRGLAAAAQLEALHLNHLRALDDIAEIAKLSALRELELSEALPQLRDIAAVFDKTALRRLDLRAIDAGFADVEWLARFTELNVLAICGVAAPQWDALFASSKLKKFFVTFQTSTGLSPEQVAEIARAHGLRPTDAKPVGVPKKQTGYMLDFRPEGSKQNLWFWDDSKG